MIDVTWATMLAELYVRTGFPVETIVHDCLNNVAVSKRSIQDGFALIEHLLHANVCNNTHSPKIRIIVVVIVYSR